MLFQNELYSPLVSIFFMIILLAVMVILYIKLRIFLVILTVYAFSLIIGMMAFTQQIPLTPYFEAFFLTFQSVMFLLTSVEAIKK